MATIDSNGHGTHDWELLHRASVIGLVVKVTHLH